MASSAGLREYGADVSAGAVAARIMSALERKVLQPPAATALLRGYFDKMIEAIETAYSAGDDGVSAAPLDELEQTALLFAHYDADGDGLLSRDEFADLIELVSSQTGQPYSSEHVDKVFRMTKRNGSDSIDFNELLLLRSGDR